MNKSDTTRSHVMVFIREMLSLTARGFAWVLAFVTALLAALAFLDIVLSVFEIYFLDTHLLVTIPMFQSLFTWLLGHMSLGFTIHHLVRPDTRIDLALKWGLAALVCAAVYWL